jgi:hypothetical protein
VTPDRLRELPSALARVSCSGERHSIRWEGGDLVALDHDDPEGERALAALGGTSCACLDVLGAWARQRENPGLLSALSRGSQDPVQTDGFRSGPFPYPVTTGPRNVVLAARGGTWRGVSPMGSSASVTGVAVPGGAVGAHPRSSSTREEDVALLAGLGHELTLRMAATVTAMILDRMEGPGGPAARPVLEASLFGRASCALRAWLGAPDLGVELEVVESGADASLEGDASGPIRVKLPLAWVTTVWGRDLTLVAGRFCVSLFEAAGRRVALMSVGSDLGPPRPLLIEFPEDEGGMPSQIS